MIRYTAEEKAFLREFIPGHHYEDIKAEFEKRFRPITINQVKAYCKNNKVFTGMTGKFGKGRTSWNKGLHYIAGGRSKETRFKKGNIPHNHKPLGSVRESKDGYLEVKVAEPNKCAQKHRLVWQGEHGEIPKGSVIVFKDGNRRNFSPDNLECISRAIHAALNRDGLAGTGEYMEAAIKLVELRGTLAKKKRGTDGQKKRDHTDH